MNRRSFFGWAAGLLAAPALRGSEPRGFTQPTAPAVPGPVSFQQSPLDALHEASNLIYEQTRRAPVFVVDNGADLGLIRAVLDSIKGKPIEITRVRVEGDETVFDLLATGSCGWTSPDGTPMCLVIGDTVDLRLRAVVTSA